MINASISVNSSVPIRGADIVAYGLRNDDGVYLMRHAMSANISEGRFNIILPMPFCLQCVKLSPGENEIVFEVRSDNMTLVKTQIGIDIAP